MGLVYIDLWEYSMKKLDSFMEDMGFEKVIYEVIEYK